MTTLSNKDLGYFTAGVADLEDYLLSAELFWNLPGYSMLTLGGLFLAKARLEACSLELEEKKIFTEAQKQMEFLTLKWRVAFENKIQREIPSRLNLWQNYLTEFWAAPDEHADEYAQEIRWRVMIQLLVNAVGGDYNESTFLKALDDRLRFSFLPGEFIWAEELSAKFNEKEYWFLYGNLTVGQSKKSN
ncbi:MAG: hypothetical protein ACK2TS_03650 [Anaerolineales bacterium]